METMNSAYKKPLAFMTYGSLMILALGLVTSISLLTLSHILIAFPAIYFLPKANYKNFPKSAWALLCMSILIACSVIFNQDIAGRGYAPLSKTKYFFIGFFSLYPLAWYFKSHYKEKCISYLLYAFSVATTFATLVGIFSRYWVFNPITQRMVSPIRNAGLFGMVMNYAHNLAFFLIIITGLVVYREKIKKLIKLEFLYSVLVINLVGLYLTYTRGAWLAYLSAIPFFMLKNNKKYFIGIIFITAILGSVFFMVAGKDVVRPQSESERISQWEAAFAAFKERPALGYGFLNFEQHSRELKLRYDLPEKNFGGHAHSNLFEMLASTGILGFSAFIVWIFCWFKEVYDRNDIVAGVALPLIVVFFIGGLTQSTISLGINLFFIMAAYSLSSFPLQSINSDLNQNL